MATSKNAPTTDTTVSLTEEQIRTSVEQSMLALDGIFVDEIATEEEVDGVTRLATKNRLWFLQHTVVNGFVWKLESTMLDARKKMLEHDAILQSYERAEHGVVTQKMRDDKEFWRDQHREAYYLTAIAFERALQMHEQLLGKPFTTAAERAEKAAAAKKVAKVRRVEVDVDAIEKRLGIA